MAPHDAGIGLFGPLEIIIPIDQFLRAVPPGQRRWPPDSDLAVVALVAAAACSYGGRTTRQHGCGESHFQT